MINWVAAYNRLYKLPTRPCLQRGCHGAASVTPVLLVGASPGFVFYNNVYLQWTGLRAGTPSGKRYCGGLLPFARALPVMVK